MTEKCSLKTVFPLPLGYFCFFGGYELCRHVLTPPGKSKDEIGMIFLLVWTWKSTL